MDDRGIRRIAAQLYRGWLWYDERPLGAYGERMAARVEPLGRKTIRWAALLSAAPLTGVGEAELLRRGVPARVASLVEMLRVRPGEMPGEYAARISVRRDAAILAAAGFSELAAAEPHRYRHWRTAHVRLGEISGTAVPAAPACPPHFAPALDDGHRHDSPAALLADYAAERRRCCRAAIYRAATAAYPAAWAAELAARWWDSGDKWEAMVATAATRDGERLRGRLDDERPDVVDAALIALARFTAEPAEIAALHRIVQRPGLAWRWSRRSAARRLLAIGGPDAEAALSDHCLTPLDPPWRTWSQWLDSRGTEHVPDVISMLDETEWWHEGPYFLAKCGATEAVPAICARLRERPDWIPGIDALGRLAATLARTGTPGAAPGAEAAMLALTDNARTAASSDARDHSLRALVRISPDAAVAAALTAVDDVHPVVRDRAARILVRHGSRDTVPALIRLCDTVFAGRAAAALGRIGDPRAEPTLWRLFTTGAPKVRAAAGRALAGLPGPSRYPDHGAQQADPGLRRAYLRLLSRQPGALAKHYVERSARDLDPRIRATTAHAIATVADPAHRPVLDLLLADTDPRVRRAAAAAVRRLPT